MTDTAPVLFEERACADGHCIGLITLNVPKALNALGLEDVAARLEDLGRLAEP